MQCSNVIALEITEEKGFIKSIQGLRGYAIIFVFLSHCNQSFSCFGALGVSIFIMLSGYLSMRKYSVKGSLELFALLKKRLRKFYPLHLITLLLAIPFAWGDLLGAEAAKHWVVLALNALLLQSWIPIRNVYFSYNAVSWYLSITIFFTLITPLMIKFIQRLKGITLYILFGTGILSQFIWCRLCIDSSYAHWLIYICPVTRSLEFFMGGGISIIGEEIARQKKGGKFICILYRISSLLIIFFLLISFNSDTSFLWVSVWSFPVIILLIRNTLTDTEPNLFNSILQNRIVVFLGNISFEFFMIHLLMIKYSLKFLGWVSLDWGTLAAYISALIFSILLSIIYKKYMYLCNYKTSDQRG